MNGSLIMMIGIPGSGKTTFAKQYAKDNDYFYISRDEIRLNLIKDKEHYFDRENDVWKEYVNRIVMHLEKGETIIADATHLNRGSRLKLLNAIRPKVKPAQVIGIVIDTPFEECMKRNNKRTGLELVPEQTMYNMNRNFKVPAFDEQFDKIYVVRDNKIIGRLK